MFIKTRKAGRRICKSVTAIALLGVLSGCNEAVTAENTVPAVRPVKLATLGELQANNIRHFPAQLSANKEVEVSFQVAGRLTEFSKLPGDQVNQGELLAAVDDRDYLNELKLREADFKLAELNFKRIEQLLEKNMVSRADFDNAVAQLQATKASLTLSQDRLADSRISAPFSGQISQIFVENHQYIQPQQTVMMLQNTDVLDVRIQLPARILSQLQQDSLDLSYRPQVIFGDAGNEKRYEISYKQHATQETQGTQSYEVVFSLPKPDDLTLYAGMGATVEIDFDQIYLDKEENKQFPLPLTAVLTNDQTSNAQVWVYNPETATVSPRDITIASISGEHVLVMGDLASSEQVVTAGLTRLVNGMQVKPLIRERGM